MAIPSERAPRLSRLGRIAAILAVVTGLAVACGKEQPPEPTFAGRTGPEWSVLLLHPEEEVRNEALGQLVSGGAEAVPVLMTQIRSNESWSHRLARIALLEIGEDSIPALAHSVRTDSPHVARWAALVLAQFGADAASVAPDLARQMQVALKAGYEDVAMECQRALYEMGPEAIPGVLPLVTDPLVSRRVFGLLEYWEAHSLPALEVLKTHPESEVREAALRSSAYILSSNGAFDDSLREWQRRRERTRPGLVQDLVRSQPDSLDQRLADELGIAEMTIDDAIMRLQKMLQSESRMDRRRAARALTGFGARSAEIVPLLVASLEAGDAQLNWEVMRTLSEIGPEAAPAIPYLLTVLDQSNDPGTRRYAAQCLLSIGMPAPGAEEHLTAMIRERLAASFEFTEIREARRAAIYALARINPEAATPVLIEVLADPSWSIQRDTIDALTLVGPAAVPALRDALASDSPRVRRNAASALMRISRDSLVGWLAFDGVDPQGDDLLLWATEQYEQMLGI